MGDFNVQVGLTTGTKSLVLGKFGHGKWIKRWERLVQYAKVANGHGSQMGRATYTIEKENKSRTTFKPKPVALKTTEGINLYQKKNLENKIQELNTDNDGHDVKTFHKA